MKKATLEIMERILTNLEGKGEAENEALADVQAELNKGAEQKAAKKAVYDEAREVVLANLDATPVTAAELYEAIKEDLPDDFGVRKLIRGLTKEWADAVVTIAGATNQYRKA